MINIEGIDLSLRFYIETFGCQMNVYDSDLVASILIQAGYSKSDNIREAEIVLLNTCAIREKAVERVIHKFQQYAHMKKKGKMKVSGILGCIPQHSPGRLKKELPFIDVLAGPDSYDKLPEMIKACLKDKKLHEDIELTHSQNYEDILPFSENSFSAYVTVTRGCNNFCTYCVVPYVRGRERSRSVDSILNEVRELVKKGITEINLLGQNVNSYSSKGYSFAQLLQKVSEVEGLKRLRFATSHPKDISDELIQVMAENPKVCSHLHLPFQSGSNEVLKRMNRGYTREEYLSKIDKVRKAVPDIALTTDIIVGFPGETEDDFAQTLDMMERVGFDNSFMFIYSERDMTYAKKNLKDDVPKKVKSERQQRVIEKQKNTGLEQIRNETGKTREVLVESVSKKRNNELMGRTEHNRIVIFEKAEDVKPGDYVDVLITNAQGITLLGEIKNSG
jgi:tRNA-2-methylthio-N6-dimethylallyladenosine synthase